MEQQTHPVGHEAEPPPVDPFTTEPVDPFHFNRVASSRHIKIDHLMRECFCAPTSSTGSLVILLNHKNQQL